jgi:hypothetical protein
MKRSHTLNGLKQTEPNMKKFYIITKPTRLSDLTLDDLDDSDYSWRDQSRQMQARRWKKLRHQTG